METVNSIRRAYACCIMMVALSAAVVTLVAAGQAFAQSVKVGRTVGGSGFHIPSYVAIDKGFLKAEGIDPSFIAATAGVLVRATIAKEIEFSPIPAGGSEAMLKGAPLVFFVGESLVSQWTLTTKGWTPISSRPRPVCWSERPSLRKSNSRRYPAGVPKPCSRARRWFFSSVNLWSHNGR